MQSQMPRSQWPLLRTEDILSLSWEECLRCWEYRNNLDTEYFFLTSLKDEFRTLQNIAPQYPKHTSMVELELKIKKAIEQGYNHVYCMIDLDNKKEGKKKTDYVNLKKKYHGKHISKPKKGIDCHIEFF